MQAQKNSKPNPHPTGELKRPFGAKGALPQNSPLATLFKPPTPA